MSYYSSTDELSNFWLVMNDENWKPIFCVTCLANSARIYWTFPCPYCALFAAHKSTEKFRRSQTGLPGLVWNIIEFTCYISNHFLPPRTYQHSICIVSCTLAVTYLIVSPTHIHTTALTASHTGGCLSSSVAGVTWSLQIALWRVITRQWLQINTRIQFFSASFRTW